MNKIAQIEILHHFVDKPDMFYLNYTQISQKNYCLINPNLYTFVQSLNQQKVCTKHKDNFCLYNHLHLASLYHMNEAIKDRSHYIAYESQHLLQSVHHDKDCKI